MTMGDIVISRFSFFACLKESSKRDVLSLYVNPAFAHSSSFNKRHPISSIFAFNISNGTRNSVCCVPILRNSTSTGRPNDSFSLVSILLEYFFVNFHTSDPVFLSFPTNDDPCSTPCKALNTVSPSKQHPTKYPPTFNPSFTFCMNPARVCSFSKK